MARRKAKTVPGRGQRFFKSIDFEFNNGRWRDQAECLGLDPDLFFPERGESTREAKAVCEDCVVREDCLEFAIANREKFGIWGGKSERERRAIRRQRNKQKLAAASAHRTT